MDHRLIRIDDYQYDLPQERIASVPLERRDDSKLLIFRKGQISHTQFRHLSELIPPDSLVIWNDTRVIPARLVFRKSTGAAIEIFLLEPVHPREFATMFSCTESCTWKVIVGNRKRWKEEALIQTIEVDNEQVQITVKPSGTDGQQLVDLAWTPASWPFSKVIDLFGKTPIPPYLKRESTSRDKESYQTVYAHFEGSVAAPTAGLHFTPELINNLKKKNISFAPVTLHVGTGTFIPVKSETIGDHPMHPETVIISRSIIQQLMNLQAEKLTVIGTTSMRSLESLFWIGRRIMENQAVTPDQLCVDQWEPYDHPTNLSTLNALEAVDNYLATHQLNEIQFVTRLMIIPGYRFRLATRLITNFHQPSSTLLLLVSALIGEKWRDLYRYALDNDFRFLSYGDSSLLEPENPEHD